MSPGVPLKEVVWGLLLPDGGQRAKVVVPLHIISVVIRIGWISEGGTLDNISPLGRNKMLRLQFSFLAIPFSCINHACIMAAHNGVSKHATK
jgi:hypothetical protein